MSELAEIEAKKAELYRERRLEGKTLADVAPSSISQAFIVAVSECVKPERVAAAVGQLLTAKRVTKSGAEFPDYRAMEAGIKLYLAYTIGLPVQRQEVVTVNVDADSETGMMDRLAKSPALRAALRKALDAADAGVIEG